MTIREILKSLFTSREVQSLAEKILVAVKSLIASNPAIAALAANLETALDELKKARKNGTYNTQTELVVAADEVRDLAFRAFWMYVAAAAIRQNELISQAAQTLQKHLQKFDLKMPYLGYSAQTAELNLFIVEMEKASEHVEGCGAMEWFNELKDSQDGFVEVQGGKVDEELEKSLLEPTRFAKEKTLQQLIALTNTLNGLEMAGIEGVTAVNQKVDQLIEQVEMPARARKTRKKNASGSSSGQITE